MRVSYSLAVTLPRRRWIAAVSLVSWALGVAVATGLAVHQLEHHGHDDVELEEASALQVVLHGHSHEAGTSDHSHDAVPPAIASVSLSGARQPMVSALVAASGLSGSAEVLRVPRPVPNLAALAPPDSPSSPLVLRL